MRHQWVGHETHGNVTTMVVFYSGPGRRDPIDIDHWASCMCTAKKWRLTECAFLCYFFLQLASHDRDMTLVTQILWGRTTHVRSNNKNCQLHLNKGKVGSRPWRDLKHSRPPPEPSVLLIWELGRRGQNSYSSRKRIWEREKKRSFQEKLLSCLLPTSLDRMLRSDSS